MPQASNPEADAPITGGPGAVWTEEAGTDRHRREPETGIDAEDPVTAIRNIGPAQAAQMARAGIPSATALRAMGADAAYLAMLRSGTEPHFIAYYVLHMALQGRPWNDCKGAEKAALRARFDAIKGEVGGVRGDAALERILDQIGTGLRR